jgi:hypothetical protein
MFKTRRLRSLLLNCLFADTFTIISQGRDKILSQEIE